MKVQAVDMTELRRRIDQKFMMKAELEMALAWADKTRYGEDQNTSQYKRNEPEPRGAKEPADGDVYSRYMMQGEKQDAGGQRVS